MFKPSSWRRASTRLVQANGWNLKVWRIAGIIRRPPNPSPPGFFMSNTCQQLNHPLTLRQRTHFSNCHLFRSFCLYIIRANQHYDIVFTKSATLFFLAYSFIIKSASAFINGQALEFDMQILDGQLPTICNGCCWRVNCWTGEQAHDTWKSDEQAPLQCTGDYKPLNLAGKFTTYKCQ